jgi:hypothetical protein
VEELRYEGIRRCVIDEVLYDFGVLGEVSGVGKGHKGSYLDGCYWRSVIPCKKSLSEPDIMGNIILSHCPCEIRLGKPYRVS